MSPLLRRDPDPRSRHWNAALLLAAVVIDLVELLPFNVPASAVAALFLMYIGVPPGRSITKGIADLVPVVELIPWCTLAVLNRRYGVDMGGLSFLFGEPAPAEGQAGREPADGRGLAKI
jgi:hypothetical protein